MDRGMLEASTRSAGPLNVGVTVTAQEAFRNVSIASWSGQGQGGTGAMLTSSSITPVNRWAPAATVSGTPYDSAMSR